MTVDLTQFRERLQTLSAGPPESVPAMVDLILDTARNNAASDIHLEPRADRLEIRLRIDGCVTTAASVTGPLCNNVVQRVKVLAGLMTYRTDIPQEGRAQAPSNGGEMRVSIYPVIHGERAVIRFFLTEDKDAAAESSLEELGFDSDQLQALKNVIEQPQGLVLLTGPAGSGKSTTLYAALTYLNERWSGRRQIITIEDPVERVIDDVTQTQINPVVGLDFASALRSILRQDPEILMVGEIRDGETAQTAVQAALTGHMLLSTIHAKSTTDVLIRLVQLGVEPFLAGSVISGVLAQRLVRRLCTRCRVETRDAAESFRASPGGCGECRQTGYQGRMLLSELLLPTDGLCEALVSNAGTQKLQAEAGKAGCIGLWKRGLRLASAGHTTIDELRRVLVPD